jgi:hypothetical protein
VKKRDGSPAAPSAEKESRRTLIKKTLLLGSAGYVAPLILGSATPASAQAVSGACNTSAPPCNATCGPNLACACIDIVGNGLSCVTPFCPNPLVTCVSNANCASDQVCMTTGCCGGEGGPGPQVCVFLCGSGGPGGGGAGARQTPWGHAG